MRLTRLFPVATLLLLALSPARSAEADGPPPMAAAGLLERDGQTDCSAVLVTPILIATAGHCVAGKKLVAEGGQSQISFQTGAYPGHPATTRDAVRIMQHPLYLAGQAVGARPLSADLALIQLDTAVPEDVARPIPWGEPVASEERLLLASYPGGRGMRARERICPVLMADGGLARLSCHVVPGESGSPVVRLTPDGPELAGVVVATSKTGHQPYALTVQARTRLLQLIAVYGDGSP